MSRIRVTRPDVGPTTTTHLGKGGREGGRERGGEGGRERGGERGRGGREGGMFYIFLSVQFYIIFCCIYQKMLQYWTSEGEFYRGGFVLRQIIGRQPNQLNECQQYKTRTHLTSSMNVSNTKPPM